MGVGIRWHALGAACDTPQPRQGGGSDAVRRDQAGNLGIGYAGQPVRPCGQCHPLGTAMVPSAGRFCNPRLHKHRIICRTSRTTLAGLLNFPGKEHQLGRAAQTGLPALVSWTVRRFEDRRPSQTWGRTKPASHHHLDHPAFPWAPPTPMADRPPVFETVSLRQCSISYRPTPRKADRPLPHPDLRPFGAGFQEPNQIRMTAFAAAQVL